MSFSVGSVLGRSLEIYGRNFLPFLLLSAVLHVPFMIYDWSSIPRVSVEDVHRMSFEEKLEYLKDAQAAEGDMWRGLILRGLQALVGMVLTSALVYGVFQQLRGKHAGVGECVSRGFRSLLSVLAVGIVAGVIIALGLVLLIVPGIILMCMYWVAVPCAVIEKAGVGSALSRSATLTKGRRWAILGIVIIPGLIVGAVGFIGIRMFGDSPSSLFFFVSAMTVLIAPWQSVCQAVGYHDLRAEKEGINVEQLAAVFD